LRAPHPHRHPHSFPTRRSSDLLHRAAQGIAAHGWPDDLTELSGVGTYTAAAVGNFAFGRPVMPVDTNVTRVQDRTGARFSPAAADRKSTRLNSSHDQIAYAVFC